MTSVLVKGGHPRDEGLGTLVGLRSEADYRAILVALSTVSEDLAEVGKCRFEEAGHGVRVDHVEGDILKDGRSISEFKQPTDGVCSPRQQS